MFCPSFWSHSSVSLELQEIITHSRQCLIKMILNKRIIRVHFRVTEIMKSHLVEVKASEERTIQCCLWDQLFAV